MSLYEKWEAAYRADETEAGQNEFWKAYFLKEQGVYRKILADRIEHLEGTVAELAEKFDMDPATFTGFLDGINTSLSKSIEVESVEESSALVLDIIYDKLYYNMLEAKADWLYELEEWNSILTQEERKAIKKKFNEDHTVRNTIKISRNDPCHCGSGKKYKKCCLQKDEARG